MLLLSNPFKLLPATRGSKIETPQRTKIRSGTLPSGITAKMDAFARHVADGFSLADAYRSAFNTANMKARTVSNDASRLARHHGVRAAIEAYRAEIEAQNRMSAFERSERIWEMIWGLIEGDDVQPAVKVRALDLAARLAGMFNTPRHDEPTTVVQLEEELRRKLQSCLS